MTDGSLLMPAGDDLLQGVEPVKEHAQAYQVLARKYRPTRFEDLIGQETMVRILERAFELNRIAHAFMLTGVRGVGKTTTARIIARALNCIGPDGKGGPTANPCGVCPECKAILADRHPDVLELDAASQRGIDDARAVIEATRYPPMQARKKVFIIDEVHMLTKEAFNALLKTLEEPPPNVVFIFATTELRKVPVTVLSRCQRFDLKRVPQDRLAAHFNEIAKKEGATLSEEALNLIAHAADGSVRDGLSLLDQAIVQGAVSGEEVSDMLGLADRGLVYDLLENALKGDVQEVLKISDDAYAKGADLFQIMGDLMAALNTIARLKAFPNLRTSHDLPEMDRARGGRLADALSQATIARCWQILRQGLDEIEGAPDRKQAADMILIRVCYASMLPTPERLIKQLRAGGNQLSAIAVPAEVGEKKKTLTADSEPEVKPAPVVKDVVVETSVETNAPVVPEKKSSQIGQDEIVLWRDIVCIAEREQNMVLYGNLCSCVEVVKIKGEEITINISAVPEANKTSFQRDLNAILKLKKPAKNWQVHFTEERGITLEKFGSNIQSSKVERAKEHPLIAEILESFPGAEIAKVEDDTLDQYALPVFETSENSIYDEADLDEDMI